MEDITRRLDINDSFAFFPGWIYILSSSHHVIFFLLYRQDCLPFFFLTSSTNFIANCCSLAARIFWSSLLSSSLVMNSLNNFKSYKVFFFVLTFSCSSRLPLEKDFMSASGNFTTLLLAIFLLTFGKLRTNSSLSGKWGHRYSRHQWGHVKYATQVLLEFDSIVILHGQIRCWGFTDWHKG